VYLKQTGGAAAAEVGIPGSPLAEDPYTTEIKHFHDVLTGKVKTPRVSAADGLAAVQIALAAIQSARTGRAISLREMG
jgi:myo-inositol 2-dehydrogenase/D-chiro-inositol 1-dehydrogenase